MIRQKKGAVPPTTPTVFSDMVLPWEDDKNAHPGVQWQHICLYNNGKNKEVFRNRDIGRGKEDKCPVLQKTIKGVLPAPVQPPQNKSHQKQNGIVRLYGKMRRHNTNAQWLQDLRADHRNLPEQEPVTITAADVQQGIKNRKSWTAPSPDMIQTYCLKNLTAVHERLAAQWNQLLP